MFFVIFCTALVRYTWLSILRVFFSDNQYFRMFLVSMADIIGSYDAVRAVAVAKRRDNHLCFPVSYSIPPVVNHSYLC